MRPNPPKLSPEERARASAAGVAARRERGFVGDDGGAGPGAGQGRAGGAVVAGAARRGGGG